MSENLRNLISVRVRETREALSLTQKQFAEKLGVSRSTICLYEAGTSMPDAEFMHNLAQIAPFNAEYLLGLSDVKTHQMDIRDICRQTRLSEAAVRQLERYGKSCQPYLNRMLEAGNVYMLATDLIRLRESYRSWTLESEQAHDERQQAVQKQFGQEYELLSPQDKLTMQEYNLDGEWNDLLRVLKKEAKQDGQKGK